MEETPEDEGVGAEFDLTADEYTLWYQRTDEDGNPVDHDYATGQYVAVDTNSEDAEEGDNRHAD